MNDARSRFIDHHLGRLDPDQLVGQLFVFGFCGPVVTPDIVELLTRYHLGGLRVTTKFRGLNLISDLPPGASLPAFKQRSFEPPRGLARDYASHQQPIACTPQEYARTLNRLRTIALERAAGVPIHCAADQEGNGSDDLLVGQRLFPHAAAYGVADDPVLTEACCRAIARQFTAVGINMIHSPVADVNVNPRNPEVGTRAFGMDAATVTTHALAALRGFTAGGVAATAKHFPGRGDSVSDAHHGLPSVDCSRADLDRIHLAPFRALIAAGVPAVMTAHSRYPALGIADAPASADARALIDLLRGELGFRGVVESDNMMMGGVLERWPVERAVIEVLKAGTDLVLLRDELPTRLRVIAAVRAAVAAGELPLRFIEEKVRRILGFRFDCGLAEGGLVDAARAADPIDDPATVAAERAIAERSVVTLRDRAGRLPLRGRALLVEQVFPTNLHANNLSSHPGLLWSVWHDVAGAVPCCEVPYTPGPADVQRVLARLDAEQPDVVVTTSWYYHKDGAGGSAVLHALRQRGVPLIVIANSPYPTAVADDLDTVVVTFHPGARECLRAAVEVITGARTGAPWRSACS